MFKGWINLLTWDKRKPIKSVATIIGTVASLVVIASGMGVVTLPVGVANIIQSAAVLDEAASHGAFDQIDKAVTGHACPRKSDVTPCNACHGKPEPGTVGHCVRVSGNHDGCRLCHTAGVTFEEQDEHNIKGGR